MAEGLSATEVGKEIGEHARHAEAVRIANFHLHPPMKVDFKNGERAPLLLVGATEDRTVPASLTKAQFKRYEKSPAKTDYLEFEGRPHLHMAAPDWEEVAAAIGDWLKQL